MAARRSPSFVQSLPSAPSFHASHFLSLSASSVSSSSSIFTSNQPRKSRFNDKPLNKHNEKIAGSQLQSSPSASASFQPALSNTADVVVVGAGLPGLSTAFNLALSGVKVRLFSSTKECPPASYAAAGMIAPDSELLSPGPMLDMCRKSRELYPSFISKLHSVVPEVNVHYASSNKFLILPPHQASEGSRTSTLTSEQLKLIEPTLNSREAILCHDDASVDARKLVDALTLACDRLGVIISNDMPIKRIMSEGNRVTSVQTKNGLFIYASHFIIMNGSWMRNLLPNIPIQPVKGQMINLSPMPSTSFDSHQQLLQHVIYTKKCYVVPKFSDDSPSSSPSSYYIGATVEDVGFDLNVTAGGMSELLNQAISIIPSFANYQIAQSWAGLRSTTPDLLPVLGLSEFSNLSVGSGFYRNGVLLAPITGMMMSAVALEQASSLDSTFSPFLQHFSPERFFTSDYSSNYPASSLSSLFSSPPEKEAQLSTSSATSQQITSTSFTQATSDSSTTTRGSDSVAKSEKEQSSEVKMFRILKDGTKEPVDPSETWKQHKPATTQKSSTSTSRPRTLPLSTYISPSSIPAKSSSRSSDISTEPTNSTISEHSVGTEEDIESLEDQPPLGDAYDDVLHNRNRDDVVEHEKLARAHNRAFGRAPSYLEDKPGTPALSLSAEEVELCDKAFQQGLEDMKHFDNEESKLASQRELEEVKKIKEREELMKLNGNIDGLNGSAVFDDEEYELSESGYY